MTVKVDDRRKEYPGNGIATIFNGPMAYSASHIQAWLVDVATNVATIVPTSGYDVDRIGRKNGTRVVMDVAPPTGQKLLLLRVVPYAQTVDITNQGDFNAEVLEQSDDLLEMQIQQLLDGQNHKIGVPETSLSNISTTMPAPVPDVLWGWGPAPLPGDPLLPKYYTLSELANFIAYGDKVVLQFLGVGGGVNGVNQDFPLGQDPGSLGNLEVEIDGVGQKNGIDFTYSGTTLHFTVAPPSGAEIQIRFDQAVPVGTGLGTAITFQQGGANAAIQSIQAKGREEISLYDYGGIGDGVTDDTAAFTKAFAYLAGFSNTKGGILNVGRGTWNVSAQLTPPNNTKVRGQGRAATVIRATVGPFDIMVCHDGVEVEGLTVDGNNLATTGFFSEAATGVKWLQCTARNMVFHGFAISNSTRCVGIDLEAFNCQQRGIILDPHTSFCKIMGAYCANNTAAGLLIGHDSHHNIISDLQIENTGNVALWIHNASYKNEVRGVIIKGTTAAAGTPGILLGYNSQDNIVSDFIVEGYTIGVDLRGAPADATYALGDTARNILADGRLQGTGSGVANSTAVLFDSTDAGVTKAVDNIIDNVIASNYQFGVREGAVNNALNNDINGGRYQADITTPYSMTGTSATRACDVRGITAIGNLGGATPAFPATNVPVTNTFPFPVLIFIAGMPNAGTRVIQINGVNTAASPAPGDGNQPHTLMPGQTITPFYGAGTPSWTWFGL